MKTISRNLLLAMVWAAAVSATSLAAEIHEAIKAGDAAKLKQLLAAKPEMANQREGRWESTPLHLAACFDNKEIVALLIAYKADVNALDRCHFTPLHFAASHGKQAAAKLLLANGADVDGLWGRKDLGVRHTPLHQASGVEMVRLLLAHKATVNALTKYYGTRSPPPLTWKGSTPLDAMERDKEAAEIIAILRAHGGKSAKELEKE